MKIAILGTGSVAQTWAKRLQELGHEVTLGTRNVESTLAKTEKDNYGSPLLKDFIADTAVGLKTFADAAAGAEIVVNATKGEGTLAAVAAAAPNMEGKVLIDLANPLDFSGGGLPSLIPSLSNTNSLGEELQKQNPNIKVVKTLNTMWCGLMVNPKMNNDGNHTNFISGNDADAKTQAKELIKQFGWADENILDLGDISNARGTEAILPIWLRVWSATQNGAFNFKVTM
jgi:8-hydroxy-5-deazaflavin:NADPH oxidoreductase